MNLFALWMIIVVCVGIYKLFNRIERKRKHREGLKRTILRAQKMYNIPQEDVDQEIRFVENNPISAGYNDVKMFENEWRTLYIEAKRKNKPSRNTNTKKN